MGGGNRSLGAVHIAPQGTPEPQGSGKFSGPFLPTTALPHPYLFLTGVWHLCRLIQGSSSYELVFWGLCHVGLQGSLACLYFLIV